MIYMVECALGPEQSDADWESWYADMKPPERLLSVPGFRSAQRFRGIGRRRQHYLAMYSVDSASVLSSPTYRGIGGGNFLTDRWKPLIRMWQRNLFETDQLAPEVAMSAALLLIDAEKPTEAPADCFITWMAAVGLDRSTPYRGLAVLTRAQVEAIATSDRSSTGVFFPRTGRMVPAAL